MKQHTLSFAIFLTLLINNPAFADEKPLYNITNQRILEDTVASLSVSSVVNSVIKKGSTLVIRNIEADSTTDRKIVALIEDQLISDLVSSGFNVFERDSNAIRRAIEEQGLDRYAIIKNHSTILERKDTTTKNPWDFGLLDSDKHITIGNLTIDADKDRSQLSITHLEGADYILNYRVQELGINYGDLESNHVKRSSIARLHIRIEDASSGRIMLARNIESTSEDSIPNEMVGTLANYRYSQFYQGYPNQDADEDNIHVYSNRRVFLQASLINSFEDGSDSISLRSPVQLGFSWKEDRISIESFSGDTVEKGLTLAQTGGYLVYGRKLEDLNFGSLKTAFVPEVGIGNAKLTDLKKGLADEDKGISGKIGIGLETTIHRWIDVRASTDIYIVKGGNYLVLGSLALRVSY